MSKRATDVDIIGDSILYTKLLSLAMPFSYISVI